MKRFNSAFFIICSILLAVVAYFSFKEAYARDEGKIGESVIRNFLADLFNVVRFPTHVLFKGWSMNPLNFSIGLVINCLLYSFLLERIVHFIFRPKVEDDSDI